MIEFKCPGCHASILMDPLIFKRVSTAEAERDAALADGVEYRQRLSEAGVRILLLSEERDAALAELARHKLLLENSPAKCQFDEAVLERKAALAELARHEELSVGLARDATQLSGQIRRLEAERDRLRAVVEAADRFVYLRKTSVDGDEIHAALEDFYRVRQAFAADSKLKIDLGGCDACGTAGLHYCDGRAADGGSKT